MGILLESSLRAVVMAAAVVATLKLFRVTSPAVTHRALVALTVAMLCLPALVSWLPELGVGLLPPGAGQPAAVATAVANVTGAVAPSATNSAAPAALPVQERVFDWGFLLNAVYLVYLIGLATHLTRIGVATWKARQLLRGARLVDGHLTHDRCVTPMTGGLLTPTVILPGRWREWSPEQLAVVMAHEEEHVRRRDPLTAWLALLNRAVFWFHPLAWWLHRRIAELAEHACDAAVIGRGHDAHGYSAFLIALARSVARSGRRLSPLELAMPGVGLSQRIDRILVGAHGRRSSRRELTGAALVGATCVALIATVSPVRTQSGTPIPSKFPGPDPAFEVASVKPNNSKAEPWDFDAPPGRVTGTNVVLRDLIRFAYYIFGGDWDIRIAGPDWIKTARYDIEGMTARPVTQGEAMGMLRRLLADRFGLKVHYENRERLVYNLVFARPDKQLGPQMQKSSIDCKAFEAAMQAARAKGEPPPFGPPPPGKRPTCGSIGAPGTVSSGGLNMTQFALQLSGIVGRPVIDKTELTGGYDWDLKWAAEVPASPDGPLPAGGGAPSIFTAVQDQLGFRLEPARGPVEVLVIDSIQQPSEN